LLELEKIFNTERKKNHENEDLREIHTAMAQTTP
jgi:hypothetical protein